MRALAVEAFGAEPRLLELPLPVPGPGELLVRMAAAAVNPFDGKIADGALRGRPHRFPLVLGVDGAGTVVSADPAVRRFRPGDRLFGQFLHDPVGTGTYAEYTVVPEGNAVSAIPERLSEVEAAAIPTPGMTALDALDRLEPAPGATLLVVGASGGIGSLVIPIAHARGLRVIAVARPASSGRLRSLGASDIVDVTETNWTDRVGVLAPGGVDAALDLMSGREGFRRLLSAVRPGGRAASTVFAAEPGPTSSTAVGAVNIDLQPDSRLLDRLARELVDRGVRIRVERTVPLEEAASVLSEIRSGRAVGKTVIEFAPASVDRGPR